MGWRARNGIDRESGDSDGRFAISGGWIQYRVEFLSPDGVNYPVLDKVTMYFE